MPISQFPAPATSVTSSSSSSRTSIDIGDAASFDDDGVLYVNPNVPGADIATGDRQEAQRQLLAQIAAATPPMGPPSIVAAQITAAQQAAGPIPLNGQNVAQVFMSGTYTSATMVWEVSHDTITWRARRGARDTGLLDNVAGLALGANATAASSIDVSGWDYFRARCSAFGASGVLNLTVATYSSFTAPAISAVVGGVTALGTAPSGNPIPVAGVDGGGLSRLLSTDSTGQVNVNQGAAGASPWPVSGTVSISGTVPVSGTLTTTQPTTPTTTQEDSAQYDDDGFPFVNPNVPGADIATGDRQEAQRLLLAQIAASTPPQSPPTTAFQQVSASGQILGPFALNGQNVAQIFISGTYASATLVYEVSQDQLVWIGRRSVRNTGAQDSVNGLALAANSTVTSAIDVSGFSFFRVRSTAFGASGTVGVVVATYGSFTSPLISAIVTGPGNVGAAAQGFPVMVGASDGTNIARYLSVDAAGQLNVNQGSPGASAWPMSVAALPLPTGAPTENAGQLQRVADLLELILLELRVNTALLAQGNQPQTDDVDRIRGDINLSLN